MESVRNFRHKTEFFHGGLNFQCYLWKFFFFFLSITQISYWEINSQGWINQFSKSKGDFSDAIIPRRSPAHCSRLQHSVKDGNIGKGKANITLKEKNIYIQLVNHRQNSSFSFFLYALSRVKRILTLKPVAYRRDFAILSIDSFQLHFHNKSIPMCAVKVILQGCDWTISFVFLYLLKGE